MLYLPPECINSVILYFLVVLLGARLESIMLLKLPFMLLKLPFMLLSNDLKFPVMLQLCPVVSHYIPSMPI